MSQTPDPDDQQDATKGGNRPGDSLRELGRHAEKVGATQEEATRKQANVDAAAAEAERLRNEPDHHGREHL